MPRTIVQEYGPIYGEPVNGTVMGRPNGSVYVPLSNTIVLSILDGYEYVRYNSTRLDMCTSDGTLAPAYTKTAPFSANSQDLKSNVVGQIYSDDELTTLVAQRTLAAGLFNSWFRIFDNAVAGLTDGQTLYIRAQLMNNGVAVATSDVFEITMVVPE